MIAALLVAVVCLPQETVSPIAATVPAAEVRLAPADVRMLPYLPAPEVANGGAVLVLPGGGYGHLAGHEGAGYAQWLCSLGFAAFVLEYRLGSDGHHYPAPLVDAVSALAAIRARAEEYAIDPARVGVIGSSAGGHLAATLAALDPDSDLDAELPKPRARPAFAILCYPVISLHEGIGHMGSRRNLLGADPSADLVDRLSIETQVTKDFPPTFVWHTADDGGVSVRNSYALADALARAGVSHELHVYEHGRHGIGLGMGDPAGHLPSELHPWTGACADWLRRNFAVARGK